MSRTLEDSVRGDAGGADFQHFFFEDELFPPELFDVGLDGAADGTEVVEPCAASVDLKALKDDESSFEQIVKKFFVLLEQLSIFYLTFLPVS